MLTAILSLSLSVILFMMGTVAMAFINAKHRLLFTPQPHWEGMFNEVVHEHRLILYKATLLKGVITTLFAIPIALLAIVYAFIPVPTWTILTVGKDELAYTFAYYKGRWATKDPRNTWTPLTKKRQRETWFRIYTLLYQDSFEDKGITFPYDDRVRVDLFHEVRNFPYREYWAEWLDRNDFISTGTVRLSSLQREHNRTDNNDMYYQLIAPLLDYKMTKIWKDQR